MFTIFTMYVFSFRSNLPMEFILWAAASQGLEEVTDVGISDAREVFIHGRRGGQRRAVHWDGFGWPSDLGDLPEELTTGAWGWEVTRAFRLSGNWENPKRH